MKCSFYEIHPASAHPDILQCIVENNQIKFKGPAKGTFVPLGTEAIRQYFGLENADVCYLPTITACNIIALSLMLQPYEGVISASSGHINTSEAGAIEFTGHKIIDAGNDDGKLTVELIRHAHQSYVDYNNTVPRAIYLTQVTEQGTVYTHQELSDIIAYAKDHDLLTYLDGARLAMALASSHADTTATEFGALGLDAFSVGATKNGGLGGEALVLNNDSLKPYVAHFVKQRGFSMSKSQVIGAQFARFFQADNLYFALGFHANNLATQLADGLAAMGLPVQGAVEANHVFVVLDNQTIDKLKSDYAFAVWSTQGSEHKLVRLVTSWALDSQDIETFLDDLQSLI